MILVTPTNLIELAKHEWPTTALPNYMRGHKLFIQCGEDGCPDYDGELYTEDELIELNDVKIVKPDNNRG